MSLSIYWSVLLRARCKWKVSTVKQLRTPDCDRSVILQGKGRTVDTAQHHVAMPGCFTLFYREPKVSHFNKSALV